MPASLQPLTWSAPVCVEILPGGRTVRVVRDAEWADASGRIWHLPAGMESDGGTIPRVMWGIVGGPFEGSGREFFLLHDHCYQSQCVTRSEADSMLLAGLLWSGRGMLEATAIYWAVRAFGARSYGK